MLKFIGAIVGAIVLVAIGAALAGGSGKKDTTTSFLTPNHGKTTGGDTGNTVAPGDSTTTDPDPDSDHDGVANSVDKWPYDATKSYASDRVRETPRPAGDANIEMDYQLGDFGDSGDPSKGYRFTAGGTITNTGNIGIVVRVVYKWKQSGGLAPIRVVKHYRLRRNQSRDIGITIPATQDQIDNLQSLPYDAQTSYHTSYVDTFGQTPYEDS